MGHLRPETVLPKIGKSMLNVNGKGGYFTGKLQVNIM
jgi:hypothetical protein